MSEYRRASSIDDLTIGTLAFRRAFREIASEPWGSEVHRQGGIATAAHPYESAWPAYDAEALSKLDGAEVVRAESKHVERLAGQLREFFARADTTAIGSSDYHGLGTVGYSRTYVFARERTERAVLDAVGEGRTVVFDGDRVEARPLLRRLSTIATLAALAAVLLFTGGRPELCPYRSSAMASMATRWPSGRAPWTADRAGRRSALKNSA